MGCSLENEAADLLILQFHYGRNQKEIFHPAMAFELVFAAENIVESIVEGVGFRVRRTIFNDDVFKFGKLTAYHFMVVAVSSDLIIFRFLPANMAPT